MATPRPFQPPEYVDDVIPSDGEMDTIPALLPPPTLADAFTTLCRAVCAVTTDHDTLPLAVRREELARMHADGNRVFAWREMLVVLERLAVLRGL